METIKALLQIQGDPTGAVQAMSQVQRTAVQIGATSAKITNTINVGVNKTIENAERRLTALSSQKVNLLTAKSGVDNRVVSLQREVTALTSAQVKAVEAVKKAENDLAVARQRSAGLGRELAKEEATRLREQTNAQRELIKAEAEVTRAKQAVAANEAKFDQLAQIQLEREQKLAAMKSKDTAGAVRLQDLIRRGQAQINELLAKSITLAAQEEAATKRQVAAEQALLVATQRVTQLNVRKTTDSPAAAEEVVRAERALKVAQNESRSAALELTRVQKQLNVTQRETSQIQTLLAANHRQTEKQEDRLTAAQTKWFTAVYKFNQALRDENSELSKSHPHLSGFVQDVDKAAASVLKAVLAFGRIGQALGQNNSATDKSIQVTRNLIAVMVNLVASAGHITSAFGKAAAGGAKLLQQLHSIASGSKLVGTAFSSTSTHLAGIAVRLSGAQMGLYAAGGAFTQLATKGREALTELLDLAGQFEQKIITMSAIVGDKLGTQISALRDKALQLGKDTMFSPNEAADVMSELIKGGREVKTVLDGDASAALDLAAASGENLDTSVRAVVSSTSIWASTGLTARDAVDNLTKAANASSDSVAGLAEGIKNVGSAGATMGVSQKETLNFLSVLSNAGLRGAQGGTALRYFFLNLIPSSQKAIDLMQRFGLMTYNNDKAMKELAHTGLEYDDTQESKINALWQKFTDSTSNLQDAMEAEDPLVGKFQQWMVQQGVVTSQFVDGAKGTLKDSAEIIRLLDEAFGKMDDVSRMSAMRNLFGERGGSKAGAAIMLAQEKAKQDFGPDANVVEVIQKQLDAMGNAADIGKTRMQGFVGSLEFLQSTIDTLKIHVGEPLLAPFASFFHVIADGIDKLDTFLSANPKILQMVGTISLLATGFAAVAGPLVLLSAAWPYIISGLGGVLMGATPLLAILMGLAAVIKGVYDAFQDPDSGLMSAVDNIVTAFEDVVPQALQTLKDAFDSTITPLSREFGQLFVRDILPFVESLIRQIPSMVRQFASFIQTGVIPFARMLVWAFQTIAIPAFRQLQQTWNDLQPTFARLSATMTPIILSIVRVLGAVLPVAIRLAASIFTNVLVPVFNTVANIIQKYVLPGIVLLADWLGRNLPPILQTLSNLWTNIVGPALESIVSNVGMLIGKIMELWESISKWLLPVLEGFWKVQGPIIVATFDVIGMAIGTVIDFLKELSDGINGWIKLFNDLTGAAKTGADKVKGAVKDSSQGFDQIGKNAGEDYAFSLRDALSNNATVVKTANEGLFSNLGTDTSTLGTTAGTNFTAGLADALSAAPAQETTRKAAATLLDLMKGSDELRNAVSTDVVNGYAQGMLDAAAGTEAQTKAQQTGENLVDVLGSGPVLAKAREVGGKIVATATSGLTTSADSSDVKAQIAATMGDYTRVIGVEVVNNKAAIAEGFNVALADANNNMRSVYVPLFSETGTKLAEAMGDENPQEAVRDAAKTIIMNYSEATTRKLTDDETKQLLALANIESLDALKDPQVLARLYETAGYTSDNYTWGFQQNLRDNYGIVESSAFDFVGYLATKGVVNAAAAQGAAVGAAYTHPIEESWHYADVLLGQVEAKAEEAARITDRTNAYKAYYENLANQRNQKAQAANRAANDAFTGRDEKSTGLRNVTLSANAPKPPKSTDSGNNNNNNNGGTPSNPLNRPPRDVKDSGGGGSKGAEAKSAAEKAADLIKNVADVIKSAIDAFNVLSNMVLPANLKQKAQEFASAAAEVVMQIQTVALRFQSKDDKLLDQTSKFADTAEKVMSLITAGVEAFDKLKTFKVPLLSAVQTFVTAIEQTTRLFVASASNFQADSLVATNAYLDTAEKSVSVIGSAVEAFAKLQDFVQPAVSAIYAVVQSVKDTLTAFTSLAGTWAPQVLEATTLVANAAGAVAENLGKVVDFLVSVGNMETDASAARSKIQEIIAISRELLAEIKVLSVSFTEDDAQRVNDYASSLGASADGLVKSLELLKALFGDDTSYKDLSGRAQELINATTDLMNRVAQAVPSDYREGKLPTYMSAVTASSDALTKNLELFQVLASSTVSFKDQANRAQELVNATADLMARVGVAVPGDYKNKTLPEYLDGVTKSSDALTKTIDLFGTLDKSKTNFAAQRDRVQELLNAVADLAARVGSVTPPDYSNKTLPQYMDDLTKSADALDKSIGLFATLDKSKTNFASQALRAQELINAVADLMARIGAAAPADFDAGTLPSFLDVAVKAFDSLDKAFELFGKLGTGLKTKVDPATVFATLLAFLLNVVGQFRAVRDEFAAEINEEDAALADTIGKSVSSIGSTLDFFTKLGDYTESPKSRIDNFLAALRYVVSRLRTLPDAIAPELLDTVQQFAEKITPAFSLLSAALDFFSKLTGENKTDEKGKTTREGGFIPVDPTQIDLFIAALVLLIQKLRDGLLNLVAPEMLDLAQAFGEKMAPAMAVIGTALDIFLKMQGENGLKPIDPDAIGALLGSIYLVLHHWNNIIIGGEFQGDFATRSEAFAASAERVFNIVQKIVDMATALSSASPESLAALPTLFQAIGTALQQAIGVQLPAAGDEVDKIFGNMSQSAAAGLSGVQTEIDSTFGGMTDELARQAKGEDDDTFVYLWGGKDLKKSLWARVISMFNGKAGARWFIIEAVRGLFDGMVLWLESRGMDFFDGWSGAIKKMRDETTEAIAAISAAISSIDGASINVSVSAVVPNVPQMAKGGIVMPTKNGTLVNTAENGEPEAIIPLSQLDSITGRSSRGNSGVTINNNIRSVTVNSITDLNEQQRRERDLSSNPM